MKENNENRSRFGIQWTFVERWSNKISILQQGSVKITQPLYYHERLPLSVEFCLQSSKTLNLDT